MSRKTKLPNGTPLPCPFCGENLVEDGDHHGAFYTHKGYPIGKCLLSYISLTTNEDAVKWNTRKPTPPEAPHE